MASVTVASPIRAEPDADPIATLDPGIVPYLDLLKRGALPIATSSVQELRDGARAVRAGWRDKAPAMHEIVEDRFEGIRYRIYRPTAEERLPAVIFFHGGGWTLMDIDTHDPIARLIAAASGAAVLSLDYPLAPEAPFPAAPDACTRFVRFVAGEAERLRLVPGALALSGDSAGANLSVATCLLLRDREAPMVQA